MIISEPKTKNVVSLLSALKVGSGKTLLVLDSIDQNVMRASNNIANLQVRNYKDVSTVDVLTSESPLSAESSVTVITLLISKLAID